MIPLVSQARAQSATELSTSRRLKAELARAFAAQQKQQVRGLGTVADMVLSSRASPLDRQHSAGGDVGAGLAIGVEGRGSSGGAAAGAMMVIPGMPPEAISGSTAAGTGACAGFRGVLSPTLIAAARCHLVLGTGMIGIQTIL